MSDPLDVLDDDVAPPPLDWRDRLAAAAAAAGLSRPGPGVLAAGAVVLSLALAAAVLVAVRSGDDTDVAATLPLATPPSSSATTSTTAGEVLVHVTGSVAAPGVHRLAGGDRVVDAVEAAGGATPAADLARLNLATPVDDGQRVYVPAVGEEVPAPVGSPAGDGTGEPAGPLDLNTAGPAELETLPGVGPAIASAIVDHRDEVGPFGSVDELVDVPGIGEARLAAVRDLVTV